MSEEKIIKPVIIVGIGQLGGVFARGFLQAGYPVYPVTRDVRFSGYPGRIPEPALVLLAVPEDGIAEALREVPTVWRDRIGLLQNELLPYVWEAEKIAAPTAMAVWFEKKKDRGVKVFQPTLVFGPAAGIVCSALTALNIPCEILPDDHHLVLALVRKNLYVLTINIAGLVVGGTTGELWSNHADLAGAVARDVLTVMEHLTGEALDREEMMTSLRDILQRVPDHACRGRVSEARLRRLLASARRAGLDTPALDRIAVRKQ